MLLLAYSSIVKPIKPSRVMRKQLARNRHHDYLTATQDIFQVLNYEGTLIMGSLGILQIDNRCEEGADSYRSAVYWFMAAVGIQLAMSLIAIVMRRDPEGRRD